MGNGLLVTFDRQGLDPRVEHALDELTAPLQAWANRGNIEFRGYSRFDGQPRCRHTIPSPQAITTGTDTSITWSSESLSAVPEYEHDNGALYGTPFLPANHTDLLLPHIPRLYDIRVSINWAANATGRREVWFLVKYHSYTVQLAADSRPANPSSGLTQSCSGVAVVEAPPEGRPWPVVYAQCFQNSGGDLNLSANFTTTWIQITKIA
jgi:hypothetical protein